MRELGPVQQPATRATSAPTKGALHWFFWPLRQPLITSVVLGFSLIGTIAVVDWSSADDVPLGFLYLLPMLILGRVCAPWQTMLVACLCTFLTERFDPFAWNLRTGLPRDVLYDIAFTTIGLFVYNTNRSRETVQRQVVEIERLSDARLDAEQQLAALVKTSPAAIVTTDQHGTILSANDAADRLMATAAGSLVGQELSQYFPVMRRVMQQTSRPEQLRTVMQTRGNRRNGEAFVAEVCFSTYQTTVGRRLTAMVLDESDEFRSREEAGLHQIMTSARLAVSAMTHEIRNVSGAIAAVHRNIGAKHVLATDQDFEALGNLVIVLNRMATLDLRTSPEHLSEVELDDLLADLRIVITPELEDSQIECSWEIAPELSTVLAEPSGLMQILLNLTNNSMRALLSQAGLRQLKISARVCGGKVQVDVVDNGGGVAEDSELFRPFQAGAQESGLGLYLSRAIARSFGGDLQYRAVAGGACFAVTLERSLA